MFFCCEDDLTSAITRRLISDICRISDPIQIANGIGGKQQVISKIQKINELASREFVVVLVDLDEATCEPEEKRKIFDKAGIQLPGSDYLCFNIAKREGESWLFADRENFSNFLGISRDNIPQDFENDVLEPKRYLLSICAKSNKRKIRNDLRQSKNSNARVGLSYNSLLVNFVGNFWDHENAATRNRSLSRMRQRLANL